MEIKIIGAGPTPKEERTPFIAMLYIEDGERKKYECTWPVDTGITEGFVTVYDVPA